MTPPSLKKGAYDQGEETAADGTRFVGRFMPWRDARAGQKFRADGTLEFDGELANVLAGLGYSKGRYYMPGGAYFVEGRFEVAALLIDLTTGAGINHAIAGCRAGAW